MTAQSRLVMITLPAEIVERFQLADESQLADLISSIIRHAGDEVIQIAKEEVQSQPISKPTPQEVTEWMAQLEAAIAELREGISDEEWEEIFWAMNEEYVDPEDLHLFDWLDNLPENER